MQAVDQKLCFLFVMYVYKLFIIKQYYSYYANIFQSLLDKFESVLNESIYTFNGCVCDENKTLKDFECDEIDNLLKNVVKIEFYRKVCLILNIPTL